MRKLGKLLENFDETQVQKIISDLKLAQKSLSSGSGLVEQARAELGNLGLSEIASKLSESTIEETVEELKSHCSCQVSESELKIVLDLDDFQTLVSGGIVKKDGAQIIISDYGYDELIRILQALKAKR